MNVWTAVCVDCGGRPEWAQPFPSGAAREAWMARHTDDTGHTRFVLEQDVPAEALTGQMRPMRDRGPVSSLPVPAGDAERITADELAADDACRHRGGTADCDPLICRMIYGDSYRSAGD